MFQEGPRAITIPPDVDFADLRLARTPDGGIDFDWTPIERICAASGIDVSSLQETDEGAVGSLIARWYNAHLAMGGSRDATMDVLTLEAKIEDELHPPGEA